MSSGVQRNTSIRAREEPEEGRDTMGLTIPHDMRIRHQNRLRQWDIHGLNVHGKKKIRDAQDAQYQDAQDCDEESGPSGRTIDETDAEEGVVPVNPARNQME